LIVIKYSYLTNKGLRHSVNEDSLFIKRKAVQSADCVKSGFIFGKRVFASVLDGVGGAEHGNVASYSCAVALKGFDLHTVSDRTSFINLLKILNDVVTDKQAEMNCASMMTTFAGVCLFGNKACFANVGDSRIYLFGNGELSRKSVDDTYANKLLKEGKSREEVEKLDTAHVITNCLGIKNYDKNKAHYFEEEVKKGDRIVLLSDGVSDLVTEEELGGILKNDKGKKACLSIYGLVMQRKAHDNFTVVILEV